MQNIMQARNTLPNLGNGSKIIYGCIVGSHAYGTNVEGSDVDKKWVYVQHPMDLFINGYKPQIEISKDEVAYELSRFLELAQKANPTILELLYSPPDCVLYKHDLWKKIEAIRKSFLTKACRYSFGGYAVSQIEKAQGLDKKMNWEKERTERKSVLDFCYWITDSIDQRLDGKFQSVPIKQYYLLSQLQGMGLSAIPHTRDLYNLFWDTRYKFKGVVSDEATSNDISLSDIPKDAVCAGMVFFNKDAYQIHCREYKEYKEWLEKRNVQRYVDIENHQQQIDGKNMLHCVRLIETALDIAKEKQLIVRRENAEFLKEIRLGKHNLETILGYAQASIDTMDAAFKESELPEKFDNAGIVKFTNYTIRKEVEAERVKTPMY